jgi:hypothetical protein
MRQNSSIPKRGCAGHSPNSANRKHRNGTPFLVDFIIATPVFKFSVHTPLAINGISSNPMKRRYSTPFKHRFWLDLLFRSVCLSKISRSVCQAEKCRRPVRRDDRAATGVLRQARGHIDSHKTHFACRDHPERLLYLSLGGWIEMARRSSRSDEAPVPCGSVEVSVLGSMQSVSSRPSR